MLPNLVPIGIQDYLNPVQSNAEIFKTFCRGDQADAKRNSLPLTAFELR